MTLKLIHNYKSRTLRDLQLLKRITARQDGACNIKIVPRGIYKSTFFGFQLPYEPTINVLQIRVSHGTVDGLIPHLQS